MSPSQLTPSSDAMVLGALTRSGAAASVLRSLAHDENLFFPATKINHQRCMC